MQTFPYPLIATPGMSDPHALVIDETCYLFTGPDVGFDVNDWVMPDWRIFPFRGSSRMDPCGNHQARGQLHGGR